MENLEQWLEEEFSTPSPDKNIENKQIKEKQDSTDFGLVLPTINPENLSSIEKEMFDTIVKTDQIAWEKGEGIQSNFEFLNEKLCGIQPGFAVLAAASNTGKSSFLLNIAYGCTISDNVYSLYFSLDDSPWDLIPRIIASNKKIPINAIRIPEKYKEYESVMKKREEGIQEFYKSLDRFKILGMSDAVHLEQIEKQVERHYQYCQENNKKFFVAIDGFHDIQSQQNFRGTNEKYIYISKEINRISEEYQIPIWCTGKLKKMNYTKIRPDKNDLKYANEIEYTAKLILCLYNEVGEKGSNAGVYYTNEEKPGKQPVLEVRFAKNKLSSFKGNLYYEFLTDYACFSEAPEQDCEFYDDMIGSEEN